MDNKVFSFLRDRNIYSLNDLETKKKMLSEQKVMEVFWPIAWDEYEASTQFINYETFSNSNKSKDLYFCFNNDIILNRYKDIEKYCCVFPHKTIIESGQLAQAGFIDGDEYVDVYKIAKTHFLYNKIISSGLAIVTPQFFYASEDSPEKGSNVSYLDRLLTKKDNSNPFLDYLYVSLPWLYNATVDDYIELLDTYKHEFENYNLQLSKIAESAIDKKELASQIIYNIKAINENIEIALEKRKSKLKSKGISTFVGVCFTLVPFLFPEVFKELGDKFFPTIFGGGTLYQAMNLYNEFSTNNEPFRESPFWVMWKWKNTPMF